MYSMNVWCTSVFQRPTSRLFQYNDNYNNNDQHDINDNNSYTDNNDCDDDE